MVDNMALQIEIEEPKLIYFDDEDPRIQEGTFRLRNFTLKSDKLKQDFLRSIYDYDEKIGRLRYKNTTRYHQAGDIAGYVKQSGYRFIKINKSEYPEHNIIWIWHFGYIPKGKIIDHKNQVKDDNRTWNIAPATYAENSKNIPMSKRNDSGVVGVSYDKKTNTWRVRINVNYNEILWGRYTTIDAARLHRMEALKYFGFSPLHGMPNSYEMRMKTDANIKKWKERRGEDKLILWED